MYTDSSAGGRSWADGTPYTAPMPTTRSSKPPRIAAEAALYAVLQGDLGFEFTLEDGVMRGADLREREYRDARASGSLIVGGSLEDARLERFSAIDLRVTGASLANATLSRSRWARVELVDCQLLGTRFTESRLTDVVFAECPADYAQFGGIITERVRFTGCRLRGAYFNDADLSGTVFEGCDLREADFSGAKLAGVDLRRSEITDIRVAPEQFRAGVTVTPDQALYLARLLGLVIAD